METIIIEAGTKKYPVYIGDGAISRLDALLEDYTNLMVITDRHVGALHLNTLKAHLPEGAETNVYTAPNGEEAKTFHIYKEALDFAVKCHLDRKSCILAFGGGAVGDLAGFVAATYMRGIAFIQIPTTILAHDSAVGGKVAINHPLGKNLVGAFYQPEFVLYDTSYLATLPEVQLRSGFAELIKHALISDEGFLDEIKRAVPNEQQILNAKLPGLLKKGIKVKAGFVKQDEKETGVRAYLNFGHTLGHALEANGGFGSLTHGEAVIIGMVYELLISRKQTGLEFDVAAFTEWLGALGYHWKIPQQANFEEIYAYMLRDKKTIAHKPRFVLLRKIGEPVMAEVDEDLLRSLFGQLQKGGLC